MASTEKKISLYAWQSKVHGQYSFFVAAESEEAARKAVEEEFLSSNKYTGNCKAEGWLKHGYILTVLPIGVAISNDQ